MEMQTKWEKMCIKKYIYSVSQIFPNFFMINVQKDLRNNKSIESGLSCNIK